MNIKVFDDDAILGRDAAEQAARAIRQAIAQSAKARIIAATGLSQFAFLEALTKAPGIDWHRVEMFHLDEYVGLSITHPASFRRYLLDRLIKPTGIEQYHLLDGDTGPEETMHRVGDALKAALIDVGFLGIGENGHLAFNDPPADFETEQPYIVVNLDEACRQQQVGEGWFSDIAQVPPRAISMSVRQILKAKELICVVPGGRKAKAVQLCLEGEITPMAPASILRTHPNTTIYLDKDSAALLSHTLVRESS
jgi:glucosamine-6-phosphate deaminase